MAKGTALVWLGFGFSLLCALLCGWIMSFNVYSVDLKTEFGLTQTQVEIAASGNILGGLAMLAAAYVIHRCGYTYCYCVSAVLVVTSGALMWMTTLYKPFFAQWIGFVALFLMLENAACSMGMQCCFLVALQMFPSRHGGKVMSGYIAIVSLGKIYYSGVYELFFQKSGQLGLFFLVTPIPTSIVLLACSFLHVPQTIQCAEPEQESLLKSRNDVREERQGGANSVGIQPSLHLPLKTIFKSGFAQMTGLSAALSHACAVTFLNNSTSIALNVGVSKPLTTVYVLSVGMTLSRLVGGVVYDSVSTDTGLAILLLTCYLSFCLAMFIGLFWLDDVTIYIICALSTVGIGTAYTLGLSLLNSVYGSKHLPALQAYVSGVMSVLVVVAQLIVGVTFDGHLSDIDSTTLVDHGFFWTFLLFVCVSMTSLILLIVNIALYIKPQVPPTQLPWKLVD